MPGNAYSLNRRCCALNNLVEGESGGEGAVFLSTSSVESGGAEGVGDECRGVSNEVRTLQRERHPFDEASGVHFFYPVGVTQGVADGIDRCVEAFVAPFRLVEFIDEGGDGFGLP